MDTFSIGICAEDKDAARVVAAALDAGYKPVFSNPCGTFINVRFVPSPTRAGDVVSDVPTPLLYGWIERVKMDTLFQLLQGVDPVLQERYTKTLLSKTSDLDLPPPKEVSGRVSVGRVTGSLTFLLHLVSTPEDQTRAISPVNSGEVKHEDAHRPHSPGKTQTAHLTSSHFPPLLGSSVRKGESLQNASLAEEAVMASRDDRQLVRNAIETVLRYGHLITEHSTSTESVYTDQSTGYEYIKFDS